jgi:hypothetical protein
MTILTMLRDGSVPAAEGGADEMTQIKILQILLIFLNPKTLRLTKDLVDLVTNYCTLIMIDPHEHL